MFAWIEGSQLCCKMWHGKDSIIYSWQANFLNEPRDCCSLQLASYKYCLDLVGKYCWCMYFQYSEMVFDRLKHVYTFLNTDL